MVLADTVFDPASAPYRVGAETLVPAVMVLADTVFAPAKAPYRVGAETLALAVTKPVETENEEIRFDP
jgi:hypothetical protein